MRLFFLCAVASAAELVLPPVSERDLAVTALYRTSPPATGKGELAMRWTDRLGRVVEERRIPVELTDETEVRFPLDMRRAVAMGNEVEVHFSFSGVNKRGAPDKREEDAKAAFIARPPDRRWDDYMIMMWQPHSAAQFATLMTLGINGGQYSGRAKTPPEFLLKNDLRWYAENIATDFYSEYHRYRAHRIQNLSFLEAKDLYRKDPGSKEAFKRHPSLSDPDELKRVHDRLVEAARTWSPYRPVFYDLGDESGIADLAAFWDFDFSDYSLTGMRAWLRERYGTLAALNRQWGTSFANWDAVMPDTTREAMRKPGDNFSAWADHKEWMDIAFARAVKMGVDAIRSVDPDAYVGIAGAQMPGWGGYDYARLSRAVTAIEPYDIGNNIEILRSLNPGVALITTAFARGPWEKHRIWYELLHGARGNIVWDEKSEFVAPDGTIGERGREVAPYYNEIRNGLGALLMNSTRLSGPVAIHYSQASMRTEWMLARRPQGDGWIDRSSATERQDSEFLRVRESYCRLIEDLGLQYDFVAYDQVEAGVLTQRGYRALILPRSSALSEAEARAMQEFVRQGGLLIADGEPGTFDEHSRRLGSSQLAGQFTRLDALAYHQQRLTGNEGATGQAMRVLLEGAGIRPEFAVLDESNQPVTGVETHTFRNGGVFIVGLLSNPQLRVDELGPPEFRSNARFEKPRDVRLRLPAPLEAYDLRTAKPLGQKMELALRLDPYEPILIAFSPRPLPQIRADAPKRMARGAIGRVGIRFEQSSPAQTHIFHVTVLNPSGQLMSHYSGNLKSSSAGTAEISLPLACDDATGQWIVRVRDLLSGQEREVGVEVYKPVQY
jgi:hypothetical protein